jgi:hypothetical protein
MLTPRPRSPHLRQRRQIAQNRGIAISATTHPTPLDYNNLDHLPGVLGARRRAFRLLSSGEEPADRVRQQLPRRIQARRWSDLRREQGRPRRRRKGRHVSGDREINIAEYNLARKDSGESDGHHHRRLPLDTATLSFLRSFKEMEEEKQVRL